MSILNANKILKCIKSDTLVLAVCQKFSQRNRHRFSYSIFFMLISSAFKDVAVVRLHIC